MNSWKHTYIIKIKTFITLSNKSFKQKRDKWLPVSCTVLLLNEHYEKHDQHPLYFNDEPETLDLGSLNCLVL